MRSRYDQPDDDSEYRRPIGKFVPLIDRLPLVPRCIWCGRDCLAPQFDPYCSTLCATQAAIDSEKEL